ncbi:MAG: hypothetical protein AAGI11_06790 [Pseudomonadota bacterium]
MIKAIYKRLAALLLLLLPLGHIPFALASTVIEQAVDGGSLIKIEVPDDWNGSLVIYNHGLDLDPAPQPVSLGPLSARQLAQGYAVAASSYSQNGWALFNTRRDLEAMMEVFRAEFGEPEEVFVHGISLGGIVTAQAWEAADIGNVVGAYPACGAMSGSRIWDGAIDVRLSYDVICSQVEGAKIPGGARGFPERFTERPDATTELTSALQACFGIFAAPDQRSAEQQARLDQFVENAGIPVSFVTIDVGFATLTLSDLIFDPTKLDGKRGLGNVGVTYRDPEIDATIRRVSPRPGAQKKLERKYELRGRAGKTKVLSTHTSGDGLLPVGVQGVLAEIVPANQLTVAIVDEGEVATHCGYTEAELVAGWDVLRAWTAGGPQPTAQDVQDACLAAEADDAAGPCRYNPDFVIPNLDDIIPPR